MAWLSQVIGAEVADPLDIYAAQAASLSAIGLS